MARLNAKWGDFWERGQAWYHFWQDTSGSVTTTTTTTSTPGSGGLKTINGLDKSLIKTWNSLVFASMKTFNGLLIGPALKFTLTFDNITNADTLVGSASSVANWNTYFDLPTNGTAFTSVTVTGNTIEFFGGGNLTIALDLFYNEPSLISVYDTKGIIVAVNEGGFYACSNLTSIILNGCLTAGLDAFRNMSLCTDFQAPALVTAGNYCFYSCDLIPTFYFPNLTSIGDNGWKDCFAATTYYLPSLTALGTTVLNNNNFLNIGGLTIDMTIPAALMTCNAGGPDGDLVDLIAYNTVNFTYV